MYCIVNVCLATLETHLGLSDSRNCGFVFKENWLVQAVLVDSCLQTNYVKLIDRGNKQTGRKVRVHLASLLNL